MSLLKCADINSPKIFIYCPQDVGETRGKKMYRKRKMYPIKCADCGKDAEVPFKPDGTRPVYCRECYQKHRRKY
jgi:CxxC-x17-CxxC domain-containing protein